MTVKLPIALLAAAVIAPAAAHGAYSTPVSVDGTRDGSPSLSFGTDGGVLYDGAGHAARLTDAGQIGSTAATWTGASPARVVAYGAQGVLAAGLRGRRLRVSQAITTRPRTVLTRVTGPFAIDAADGGRAAVIASVGSRTTTARPILRLRRRSFGRRIALDRRGHIRTVAVAVDTDGATLAAWVRGNLVYARLVSPTGSVGRRQKIGRIPAAPVTLRADVRGERAVVAFAGQRVIEGLPASPFDVWAAAASRGRFDSAQKLDSAPALESGAYVAGARVGAVIVPDGRTLVAWTGYDGSHFVVRAREVAGSLLDVTLQVSPSGQDAVFGDLAGGRDGSTAIAYVAGVRGADAAAGATPTLHLATRADGQTAYGTSEAVSGGGYVDVNGVSVAVADRVVAAWREPGRPIQLVVQQ